MKSDRLTNLPDRRRITVTAQVAADVVEDLALALRQVLDEVHRSSSVSRIGGVGPSVVLWPTKMFESNTCSESSAARGRFQGTFCSERTHPGSGAGEAAAGDYHPQPSRLWRNW